MTTTVTATSTATETTTVASTVDCTFPKTPILDDFNRDNGPLGDDWDSSDVVINGNKAFVDIYEFGTGWWYRGGDYVIFNAPFEFYYSTIDNSTDDIVYELVCNDEHIFSLNYVPSISGQMDFYYNGNYVKRYSNINSIEGFGIRVTSDGVAYYFAKYDNSDWTIIVSVGNIPTSASISFVIQAGDAGDSIDNFGGGEL